MQVERHEFTSASERAQALTEHQHAGVLSSMTPAERTKAVSEHIDSDELAPARNNALVSAALTQSIHARPVHTLAQLLNKIPVADLRAAVRQLGPQGELIAMMKKKDIVSFLSYSITNADLDFMDLICFRGTRFANGIRQLCEAGGSIQVPFDDIRSTDQLLMPVFPIVYLTDINDVFTNVVPDEICKLLKDQDWEEAMRRAARMDEAIAYFDLLVDFCGIVPFDEAWDAYREQATDPLPDQLLEYAIGIGTTGDATGFELYQVEDELCLVHSELLWFLDEDDEYEGYSDFGADELADLRELQNAYELRPLTQDMLAAKDVVSWIAHNDVAQELLAFLDDHMPEGTNEYIAADVAFHAMITRSQQSGGMATLLTVLEELGFIFGEDQLDYVVGLCAAIDARTPRWDNNGWTSLEVLTREAPRTYDMDEQADVIPFGPRDVSTGLADMRGEDPAEILQLGFDIFDE